MKHRIKNNGPSNIFVIDFEGATWVLNPGEELDEVEFKSILHDKRQRVSYSVEPVDD